MGVESFLQSSENLLAEQFLRDGFVIQPAENPSTLDDIRAMLLEESNLWLTAHSQRANLEDLALSHELVLAPFINDVRLHLYSKLNAVENVRQKYFGLASTLIQSLVGNELAMQNKVNLSIQQPLDQTSVLELHSDVWSGDSPFQVVLWVPMTDSLSSNAMFLLNPELSFEAYQRALDGELDSMAKIHSAYESQFKTIEVRFGEILIFDSNCLHGNQVNRTETSRWSLNCRVASLLAPATTPERRLGSYYTPIMVRAATRMGLRAIEALRLRGSL